MLYKSPGNCDTKNFGEKYFQFGLLRLGINFCI